MAYTALSVCSGAGGFDLGLRRAGFHAVMAMEMEPDARATFAKNFRDVRFAEPPDITLLKCGSVRKQMGIHVGELDLLFGGPPCQPFSKAGLWHSGATKRLSDPRAETIVAFMDMVECLRPRVVLIENVEGLASSGNSDGVSYIKRRFARINRKFGTEFEPSIISIDAVNFGVPQSRKRLFVVASRDGRSMRPPSATHGNGMERVVTAWDAIGDLAIPPFDDDLQIRGRWASLIPTIPEGWNYQWHTDRGGGLKLFGWRTRYWNFLLKLAKNRHSWTIPANPGPAAGPFHWDNRLLSLKELARLQCFPDDFSFVGNRRSVVRQIGNAVPPPLGHLMGLEIRKQLFGERCKQEVWLPPACLEPCPRSRRPRKLQSTSSLPIANTEPHPGTGRGPGALRRLEGSESQLKCA